MPCYCYGSKEALGRCIGKEFRASLAVTDENLAKAVEKKLKEHTTYKFSSPFLRPVAEQGHTHSLLRLFVILDRKSVV